MEGGHRYVVLWRGKNIGRKRTIRVSVTMDKLYSRAYHPAALTHSD